MSLQSLHSCRITSLKADGVSLCLDNEVELSFASKAMAPVLKSATVRLIPPRPESAKAQAIMTSGQDTQRLFETFSSAVAALASSEDYTSLPPVSIVFACSL